MTTPLLDLTVHGTPAGQGNLRTGRHGRAYHANGPELRAWRSKIRAAALDQLGRHEFTPVLAGSRTCLICGTPRNRHGELLGPVRLEAVITVPRPATVRARWPVTRSTSDWDHYGRAISDALTGVAYVDDSQVIDGRAIVTYPRIHPDALDQPGARIRIWPVETP